MVCGLVGAWGVVSTPRAYCLRGGGGGREDVQGACRQAYLPLLLPPGGALWYRTSTHCQTAAQSRSGEGQNIGAVNSFEGKKEGGQLQTEHLVRVAFWKMCLFPLYFEKYTMLIILHAL